jgi:hypothetical protein
MAALVAGRGTRPRVGVALSPDSLCAAVRRDGHSRLEAWRVPLAPLNGDGGSWPGLADALRMLAREMGTSDGRLTVALMPPLAEARSVDLPKLSDDELQQLLARGAGKYFATARGQQVVGAIRAGGRTKGATVPLVAVAAGARLVSAIQEAATSAGWDLEGVIPAEAAWSAAAAQSGARGTSQLLVAHADRTDLLTVRDGTLAGIRRFRTGGEDARLIADAFPSGARQLGMVGSADARREVARVLAARGLAAEALPGVASELADSPDFLAAAFATPHAAPMLVTDSMRAAQHARVRTLTLRLAVAAGLLVVTSFGLEWWGLKRELDSVRAERAALAPQISSTLVGRTTVENAFRQLAALGIESRATTHWSGILSGLSQRLPGEAFLTGFRGRGDSVSVDGLAAHAARVFDALDKVPGLTGVRSAGPVRLETPDDGPPMERFAIAAQVAQPPGTKPVAKPAAARGGR